MQHFRKRSGTRLLRLNDGRLVAETPEGTVLFEGEGVDAAWTAWQGGEVESDVLASLAESGLAEADPGLAKSFELFASRPEAALATAALRAAGLSLGVEVDVRIVLAHRSEGATLRAQNAEALRRAEPTLFVEWHGAAVFVGPVVRVGHDASCWRCGEIRSWANASSPAAHAALRAAGRPDVGDAPPAALVAAGLAAHWAREVAGGDASLVGSRLVLDLKDGSFARERVLRVPDCDACSG